MLSTAAPAQVAQSVEQWTEKPFQSALPTSRSQLTAARLALGLTPAAAAKASRRARRLGAQLAAGSISLRQLRASLGGAR